MAQRQNTNNPVPSNSVKDLNDDIMAIDAFVNSNEATTTDRFGNPITTLAEISRLVNEAIGEGRVVSVNGKNGIVTITAEDIGAVAISKGEVKQDISFSGNISVKGKPLLSLGDYGVGGLTLQPLSSFNQSVENGYYYAIGAESEEPTEGAPEGSAGLLFVNVKTTNDVTIFDVIGTDNNTAVYTGRCVYGKAVWAETITTDNLDKFITKSAAEGDLLNVEVFKSSGTYTPSANVKKIKVHVVGGGGGGGGYNKSKSGAGGNGGGGGGYSMSIFNINDILPEINCTVGAGGTGGNYGGGTGTTGGSSKFGTYLTANGGFGGSWNNDTNPGGGGGATGGLMNIAGGTGYIGGIGDGGLSFYSPIHGRGGHGAPMYLKRSDSGTDATSYNGYAGASGIIIIEEFSK